MEKHSKAKTDGAPNAPENGWEGFLTEFFSEEDNEESGKKESTEPPSPP